jgi:hypothetical protein
MCCCEASEATVEPDSAGPTMINPTTHMRAHSRAASMTTKYDSTMTTLRGGAAASTVDASSVDVLVVGGCGSCLSSRASHSGSYGLGVSLSIKCF